MKDKIGDNINNTTNSKEAIKLGIRIVPFSQLDSFFRGITGLSILYLVKNIENPGLWQRF